MLFCRLLILFSQINPDRVFFFRNTIGVSNNLDTDQTRRSVGSDLGPNCLPMLSAEDTSRQRIEILVLILLFIFPGSMVLLRTQLQPHKK